MSVLASIEECLSDAMTRFEIVGQFAEHLDDVILVALESSGVKAEGLHDLLHSYMVGRVFALLEQAVGDDRPDPFRIQDIIHREALSYCRATT